MTLPDPAVMEILRRDFVVGWHNIERAEHCGLSHGYARTQTALGTTNGAGGRNLQLFVLAPDTTVLHALPGFWHPDDLLAELAFARVVERLWRDPRDPAAKRGLYRHLHEVAIRNQSVLTTARSEWQSFDRATELARAADEPRDTVVEDAAGRRLLPLNALVHTRMAEQAFVPFAQFDVEALVDYGRPFYDNNAMVDDGGKTFRVREALETRRARERARAGS